MLKGYLGARCEVKTTYNELLLVGKFTKYDVVNSMERVYIGAHKRGDFMPILPINIRVKIVFYLPGSEVKVYTGQSYISSEELFCADQLTLLSGYEKRNHFRVKYISTINLFFDDNSREMASFLDLSLSGCAIRAYKELNVGDVFEILFAPSENCYLFNCQVRRVLPPEEPGKPTIYGCSFEDMTEEMSSDLCAYLFQLQKLELKKHRNNAFQAGERKVWN